MLARSFQQFSLALILGAGALVPCHAGEQSQYFLLDNGTAVFDKSSNLIWKRCQEGKRWEAGFCKGIGTEMNWDEARRSASKEWRVPTIDELKSLAKPANAEGTHIDLDFFPDTDPGTFWSSSLSAEYPQAAWDFNFRQGFAFGGANRTYKSYVRLVRSKNWTDLQLLLPAKGANSLPRREARTRYVLTSNEEVVLDQRTGLAWKRCQEGKRLVNGSCKGGATKAGWHEAKQAGSDGWRLPSKGELKSLVEIYAAGQVAINEKFFPDTEPGEFWSSSASDTNSGAAWAVDFGNGYDSGNVVRFTPSFIRLVKSSP